MGFAFNCQDADDSCFRSKNWMMNRMLLLVGMAGIGGCVGSICRYLAGLYFSRLMAFAFPFGTFFVNVAGCLLIGLLYGLSERYQWFNLPWRILLITGFCGGFTTFSSFAYENLRLLQSGQYMSFALYSTGSFVLGLLACFGGILLTKLF